MRLLAHSTVVFSVAVLMAGSVQAAPKVIASIVPVHALVAGIMDGVGTPELLLSGQTSEHQASYSPQQIQALGDADLVFVIGHGLELKLSELSGSEATKGKRFVELSDVAGLRKLPIREGGAFAAHGHGHDADHEAGGAEAAGHEDEVGHDHDSGKADFDPHLWLDPANAKVMVAAIASDLAKADPAYATQYAVNAKAVAADLDVLATELSAELSPVKDRPFVVFHDAFQYFEDAFGLQAAGSISDFSGTEPSALRLKEVRDKIVSSKAVCVFREPQFSDRAARVVLEGTTARDGVLDPIGSTLTPGKGAYRELLLTLARNLKSCLSG